LDIQFLPGAESEIWRIIKNSPSLEEWNLTIESRRWQTVSFAGFPVEKAPLLKELAASPRDVFELGKVPDLTPKSLYFWQKSSYYASLPSIEGIVFEELPTNSPLLLSLPLNLEELHLWNVQFAITTEQQKEGIRRAFGNLASLSLVSLQDWRDNPTRTDEVFSVRELDFWESLGLFTVELGKKRAY